MYIKHELLIHCLDKAREIAEQYKLYVLVADDPLRSVDKLTEICRKYLNKEIEIFELDIDKNESPVFGASILKEGDARYDICHVKNLNYCWQRFVVCKELFHVVLDEEKYRSMGISQHLDEVTVAFPDDESRPSEPVIVEQLAEIAAMEFLFPYAVRVVERSGINGNVDCRALAERFKVPLVYLERYLSQPYMDALKDK
jgi:Zn-dependent peptidase ImmA (M78 family)